MVSIKRRREAVFRAIADPTRRQVLDLLRNGTMTVGEIAGKFKTSRPAVSKHLRMLRGAGLIVTHRAGTTRVCELNPTPLRAVDAWLSDYALFWTDKLHALKRYAEEKS